MKSITFCGIESGDIKDKEFANDLYKSLCNQVWYNTQNNQLIGYSWRMSAHFVASIRNEVFGFNYKNTNAEKYDEYQKLGGEGEVSERIMKFMESNGIVLFKGFFESLNMSKRHINDSEDSWPPEVGLNTADNDYDPCGSPTNYDKLITKYLREYQLSRIIE